MFEPRLSRSHKMAGSDAKNTGDSLLWVLVLVGYPIAAAIATAFAWESATTSYPFRAIVLLMSVVLVTRQGILKSLRRLHPGLLLFFSLYALRLIWDGLFIGQPFAVYALIFFLSAVVMPAIALANSSPQVGACDKFPIVVAAVGVLICGSVMFMEASGLAGDKSLTELTQRLYMEALNPISLGHVASTTIIASFVMLVTLPAWTLPLSVLSATIALFCLIWTASRGPVLSLVAALFFLIWVSRNRCASVLLAIAGIAVLIGIFSDNESQFIFRLHGGGLDESSQERLLLQSQAIRMFLQSPLIGSCFAEDQSLAYPHNIFVETLMSLGLIGFLPLCWVLWSAIGESKKEIKLGHLLIPMVFVQYFFAFQFSGSIWGSSVFWVTLAWLTARKKLQ